MATVGTLSWSTYNRSVGSGFQSIACVKVIAALRVAKKFWQTLQ